MPVQRGPNLPELSATLTVLWYGSPSYWQCKKYCNGTLKFLSKCWCQCGENAELYKSLAMTWAVGWRVVVSIFCGCIHSCTLQNQFLQVLLFLAVRFVLWVSAQLGSATIEAIMPRVWCALLQSSSRCLETCDQKSTIHACVLPASTYECGGVSGWTRVMFINMTDTSQQCPSRL